MIVQRSEAVEKLTFSEQPLDRNHAFDRISKKNRALQAHFFFPCINSEVHAPGIYEFAPQILFYACCRTKHKSWNAAFSTDWDRCMIVQRSFFRFGRWKHHGFPVRALDKSPSDLYNNTVVCRVSSSVERSLPKPPRRVRFPYPAPKNTAIQMDGCVFFI